MLPWAQEQALPDPDIFGLMVIGFGMAEAILGEMGIGRIRKLVTNGSLAHGEKSKGDTSGDRVVGNSQVQDFMVGYDSTGALLPRIFSRSSL